VRILLDTSVLVAAMLATHPAHRRALAWLQRIRQGADVGLISAHSLAELYAVLTRLPAQPRFTPEIARHVIQAEVLTVFQVVPLTANDYEAVIDHLASLGATGGAVYDALILRAAEIAGADRIVTLNERDFRRIYPALADRIVVP
jgi:predicted nucleic acid-binding protein